MFQKLRVAGTSFRQADVRAVSVGDDVYLLLEPGARCVVNAIKRTWWGDEPRGVHVPREQAAVLAPALAGGHCLVEEAAITGKGQPDGADSYGLAVEVWVRYLTAVPSGVMAHSAAAAPFPGDTTVNLSDILKEAQAGLPNERAALEEACRVEQLLRGAPSRFSTVSGNPQRALLVGPARPAGGYIARRAVSKGNPPTCISGPVPGPASWGTAPRPTPGTSGCWPSNTTYCRWPKHKRLQYPAQYWRALGVCKPAAAIVRWGCLQGQGVSSLS